MEQKIKVSPEYFGYYLSRQLDFIIVKGCDVEPEDLINIAEYDFQNLRFTGREIYALIKHKFQNNNGMLGLKAGFCGLLLEFVK
jgi:hypothetical protein